MASRHCRLRTVAACRLRWWGRRQQHACAYDNPGTISRPDTDTDAITNPYSNSNSNANSDADPHANSGTNTHAYSYSYSYSHSSTNPDPHSGSDTCAHTHANYSGSLRYYRVSPVYRTFVPQCGDSLASRDDRARCDYWYCGYRHRQNQPGIRWPDFGGLS